MEEGNKMKQYKIIFADLDGTLIDSENAYTGMKKKLPKIIHCNYGSFEFETEWLDIDYKSYFEDLKYKSIDIKTTTIKNVESSLNKHKEELESLKKLIYETLDCKR